MTISNRGVGEVANFKCHLGYKLYGQEMRQCLPNGLWGGFKPQCRRKYFVKQ